MPTLVAPLAPGTLSYVATVGSGSITLTWSAPDAQTPPVPVINYTIRIINTSSPSQVVPPITTTATSRQLLDDDLVGLEVYSIYVEANGAIATGPPSNTVLATMPISESLA